MSSSKENVTAAWVGIRWSRSWSEPLESLLESLWFTCRRRASGGNLRRNISGRWQRFFFFLPKTGVHPPKPFLSGYLCTLRTLQFDAHEFYLSLVSSGWPRLMHSKLYLKYNAWHLKWSDCSYPGMQQGPCTFRPFVRRRHSKTNCHSRKSIFHYSFWNFRSKTKSGSRLPISVLASKSNSRS